jgi:hypothetical protein
VAAVRGLSAVVDRLGRGALAGPWTATVSIGHSISAAFAYAGGMLLRRRIRPQRQSTGIKALGWLAAAVAVVAAVAGTALWAPSARAQGVKPLGSIGNDRWIRGYGYQVRLIPNWYVLGSQGQAGLQVLFSRSMAGSSTWTP